MAVRASYSSLGPHDFRHTYSTWLEDAGIPARVIDKLMGHRRSRRSEAEGRSRIGDQYREHLTPGMQARVVAAVEERLAVVLEVAEQTSIQRAQIGHRAECRHDCGE